MNAAATMGARGSDGSPGAGTTGDATFGVTARQNLYRGGQDQAAISARAAERDAQRARATATAATIRAQVLRAHARLLYAQQHVTLATTIAARRSNNVDLVRLRFEAGREHRGALAEAEAAATAARIDLAAAQRDRAVAAAALRSAIGLSGEGQLVAAGELTAAAPGTVTAWAALAEATPNVVAAGADLWAARENVAATRGLRLPTVDLSAGLSRGGDDFAFDRNAWDVGLTATVPLWRQGAERGEARVASLDVAVAAENLRRLRLDAAQQLRSAHAALVTALSQVAAAQTFVDAAAIRADISTQKYTLGLLSFEDWTVIEDDWIRRHNALLQSRRDAALAAADWDEARGLAGMP